LGFGFWILGIGFRALGVGFRVFDFSFCAYVQGLRFRVEGGCRD